MEAVENKDGWHGKALDDPEAAIEELGGIRNIVVDVPKPEIEDEPHRFETGTLELPTYELGEEVATRKAYGDALKALGDGRGDVVALDGEVSNSTFAEIFRRGAPGPVLRDVHRRAADGRRGGRDPGARLEAVRLDLRGLLLARVRLRAHGGDQPRRTSSSAARMQASRSARTARRRWRSRISLRSEPSTARPFCTRATRTRRPSSSRPWPTWTGSSYMRTTRAEHAGHLRAGRGVPGRRLQGRRAPRTTTR